MLIKLRSRSAAAMRSSTLKRNLLRPITPDELSHGGEGTSNLDQQLFFEQLIRCQQH